MRTNCLPAQRLTICWSYQYHYHIHVYIYIYVLSHMITYHHMILSHIISSLSHIIILYCLLLSVLPVSVFSHGTWPLLAARQLELVAPSPAAVGRCHAHVATPRTPREDVGRTYGTHGTHGTSVLPPRSWGIHVEKHVLFSL